jgi:hypothetical protein
VIVRTVNPWSPTYWRDVECCLQFSGWDFKGHVQLDIDGGASRSYYRLRAQGKFQQCFQFGICHGNTACSPENTACSPETPKARREPGLQGRGV